MLLLLLACTDAADTADSAPRCEPAPGQEDATWMDVEGEPSCGQAVYEARCEVCHDDNDVDLSEHVPAHTDADIVLLLLAGSDGMPPQSLSGTETAHVLAWMRQQWGEYDGEGH